MVIVRESVFHYHPPAIVFETPTTTSIASTFCKCSIIPSLAYKVKYISPFL